MAANRQRPHVQRCAGENLLSAFTRAVSLGGNRALLVQALLNKAYSSVVPDDVTPGSEFTAARQVCYAQQTRMPCAAVRALSAPGVRVRPA